MFKKSSRLCLATLAADKLPQWNRQLRLSTRGKQLEILTRNSDRNAHEILNTYDLAPFFLPEYGLSHDFCAPKPNPDGVRLYD